MCARPVQCAGGPRSSCATDASTSGARSLAPRAFSLTHGLPPWDPSLYGPHTFTQAGDPSQRLRTRATARPAPGASARVHGVIDSGASARALSGRWADDTKIITTSRDRRIFRRRKLRATRVSALQLHGSNARTFGYFDFFRLRGLLVLTFPASHGTLDPILPLDYPNDRSHPSPRTQGRSCSTLEHARRLCGGSGCDGTCGRCRGEALGGEGAKYGKYGKSAGGVPSGCTHPPSTSSDGLARTKWN